MLSCSHPPPLPLYVGQAKRNVEKTEELKTFLKLFSVVVYVRTSEWEHVECSGCHQEASSLRNTNNEADKSSMAHISSTHTWGEKTGGGESQD